MRLWFPILLLALTLPTSVLAAVQITSITPETLTSGTRVIVTGGPFGEGVEVLLGEERLPATILGARSLTFTVPALPPGQYLLRLTEAGLVSPQTFTLHLVEPTPRLATLDPQVLEACSANSAPTVSGQGSGFLPGASLLIDGAAVPASFSTGSITFQPPALSEGRHEVVVINPGGSRSLSQALTVDATPVIESVEVTANNVTTEEITVRGRNFLGSSQLVVGGQRFPLGTTNRPQDDSAVFVDCQTILFTRHPYSSDPKPVPFQVVSPGGKQSQVYTASIP